VGIEIEKGSIRMKTVVCDTGPILHLKEANLLNLLEKMGVIYIPHQVDAELSEIDNSWSNEKPFWISIHNLSEADLNQAEVLSNSGLLAIGESAAIILSKQLKADWFLTDDASARIFASTMGIEVHGSLGVVLWAAATGHLGYEEAKLAIKRLSQSSLWISQNISRESYQALDEMFL
jgi:predicted nucleic acid-binding protein